MTVVSGASHETTDALAALRESLAGVLEQTGGRVGLLMDGNGAVILESGDGSELDRSAFACLTVNHFGATRALATLIGEHEFRGLCHQGEHSSIYVADVAGQVILSVLFEGRRPAGQVSEEGKRIVSSLEGPVRRLLEAGQDSRALLDARWVRAARREIDRVFREGA